MRSNEENRKDIKKKRKAKDKDLVKTAKGQAEEREPATKTEGAVR